ncbi:MAG: hypothetical protein AB7P01_15745 [Bacteroidia bacterium]|jgi:hypothetical protein
MKKILFPIVLLVLSTLNYAYAQSTNGAQPPKGYTERIIPGVEIGKLMCEDENGKMVICSGNEFEKILGFATNVPYVTVNKPQHASDKKDEFSAFASTASGKISKGDYLTAGKNGTVVRCEKTDFPYAVALEDATSEGQKFSVKILGNRR